MASRNRGKSKPSLRDLSRIGPTNEERAAIWETLRRSESPIQTAILGASLVEHELETELRAYFRRSDDETWKAMTSDVGPLSTFSQKITAAYALGIIDSVRRDGLNTIRQIRNAFAHAKRLIDFNHELVLRELRTISLPKAKRSQLHKELAAVREAQGSPRLAYGTLCLIMSISLLDRRLRRVKAKNARARTLFRRQKLATALRQTPSSRGVGLLGLLGGYPPVDPKKTILGEGSLGEPDSEDDPSGKKDK